MLFWQPAFRLARRRLFNYRVDFRVLGGFCENKILPAGRFAILILAVSLAANVFSQQTGAARRQPAAPPEGSLAKAPTSRAPVSAAVVKSDLSEALSVIQDNYIDGKKLGLQRDL